MVPGESPITLECHKTQSWTGNSTSGSIIDMVLASLKKLVPILKIVEHFPDLQKN